MKQKIALLIGASLLGVCLIAPNQAHAEETKDMYELFNPDSGERRFVSNIDEKRILITLGWMDKGVAWTAPTTGDPVYTLYNPNNNEVYYTLSDIEGNNLVKIGWKKNGIGWYSDKQKRVPVYHLYNGYALSSNHTYTTKLAEVLSLTGIGWSNEGEAWYGVPKEIKEDTTTSAEKTPEESTTKPEEEPVKTTPTTETDANTSTNTENTTTSTTKPETNTNQDTPEKKLAKEYFALVNQERKRVGVPELIWSDEIYKAAVIRSKEMTKLFEHTRPDGSDFYTVEYEIGLNDLELISEVANKGTDEPLMIFKFQKRSPQHYELMIDPIATHGAASINGTDRKSVV